MLSDDPTRAQVLVVIVAYQSGPLLARCLSAIAADEVVAETIVVDNASQAEAAEVTAGVAAHDPRFRYVDPGENLGFARGCNFGVASSHGAWTHVFFVNPDVQMTASFESMVDEIDNGAAIVAGRLVSPGHPLSVNARALATMSGEFHKAFVGSRAYRFVVPESAERSISVEQVDGALMGMSRTTFERLAGFDERFELYYEDVDLCARAAAFGGCRFVLAPCGIHEGGASYARASAFAYQVGRVSRVRYLRKHYGSSASVFLGVVAIAVAEWLMRSVTRQSEGVAVRSRAVALQARELLQPLSLKLLR